MKWKICLALFHYYLSMLNSLERNGEEYQDRAIQGYHWQTIRLTTIMELFANFSAK